MKTDAEVIAEVAALASKATEGPWHTETEDEEGEFGSGPREEPKAWFYATDPDAEQWTFGGNSKEEAVDAALGEYGDEHEAFYVTTGHKSVHGENDDHDPEEYEYTMDSVTPIRITPPPAETPETFQSEQWRWCCETFPNETVEGVLRHLESEFAELKEAPFDPMEMADCFLLLQCLASHCGVDLMKAAREKFEKCKARKWEQTSEGYRHVKSPDEFRKEIATECAILAITVPPTSREDLERRLAEKTAEVERVKDLTASAQDLYRQNIKVFTDEIEGLRAQLATERQLGESAMADAESWAQSCRAAEHSLATAQSEAELLSILETQSWGLIPVDVPTGGDDADIAWHVIEYHMSKPHERVIGHGETPAKAIRSARQEETE